MKNGTEVTLNVSLNLNSISSYQTNFSDKIFFVDRQISTLRRAFKVIENSTDKIGLSGEILGGFLGPSLKTGLLLMKNVLKSLAEIFLVPLELTASGSVTVQLSKKKKIIIIWYDSINNFILRINIMKIL